LAEPGWLFPERGCPGKKTPLRMTFAVPISFFESISIIFGGAGLIFEGLKNPGGCWNKKFCQGSAGVNPQRSNQSALGRNLFWEMLSQKETETALG
jgi:hypothetical protein